MQQKLVNHCSKDEGPDLVVSMGGFEDIVELEIGRQVVEVTEGGRFVCCC